MGEAMNEDEDVRGLLWDINFAVNGKPMKQPVGPTSYTTHGAGGERPDLFRVHRNGRWFVVSARPATEEEEP
jgi:hypothetical protein